MKKFSGVATVALCAMAVIVSAQQNSKFFSRRRPLSFAERVAYQYAVEEIYWRHRIWPKENTRPKPSLDKVMSRAQIEKKVEDYLHDSKVLEDYWQRPIAANQLQAEMERIATHTRQPEVLREIFRALNDDPVVIAECLARPVLVERLLTELNGNGQIFQAALKQRAGAELKTLRSVRPVAMAAVSASYTLPVISGQADNSIPSGACIDDTWRATSTANAPAGRYYHTAVWTGSEMIVWGGTGFLFTGGRYDPSTDSWTATSTTNAPGGRQQHTAVWTGSEMIVWGGFTPGSPFYVDTGGRYNPGTNTWTATSTANAPSGRAFHTAVWTGSEMIVWGGGNPNPFNTGGRYDPSTDSWTATSTTNVPGARYQHTAVWTGTEMIVWGGCCYFNTGGRYNATTDTWTTTSTANAPAGRIYHTAIWTGSEMIVWGGSGDAGNFNTGGKYDPGTDGWTATSTTNAPGARAAPAAVWTGSEMIVWGGGNGSTLYNTGGRYNPGTDSWTATSTTNAPAIRIYPTGVWTGSEMIVWGGLGTGNSVLNTGGKYCAQTQAPVAQSAASRKTHGGAGDFDINLPLAGTPGIECRTSGGTNDYTMLVIFSGNVTVTGNPEAQVSLGTGCVGNAGICTGNVTVSGNTVTIPLTNIANAQTINVQINGVNSAGADSPATDFTVPMSILIGDASGNGTVNTGDVALCKSRLSQPVDTTNFRSDANANGGINSGDVVITKSHLGTGLP